MLERVVEIGSKQFFKDDSNKTVFYKERTAWGDIEYGYVIWDKTKNDYISKSIDVGSLNELKLVTRYGTKNYQRLIKSLKDVSDKVIDDKIKGGFMDEVVRISMFHLLADDAPKELEVKKPMEVERKLITWQEIPFLFEPKLIREEELDWTGAKELVRVEDPMGPDILYQMNDGRLVLYNDYPLNAGIGTYEPVEAGEEFLEEMYKLLPLAQEMFKQWQQKMVTPSQEGAPIRRWHSMYLGYKRKASMKRRADLQSKMPKVIKRYMDKNLYATEQEAIDRINLVNQADPTGSLGSYTDWLVNQDINKVLHFPEDADRVKDTLRKYDRAKVTTDIDKNVWSFKTFPDLEETLTEVLKGTEEELGEKAIRRKEQEQAKKWFEETGGKGIEEVYNDGTWSAVKITDAKALQNMCLLEAPGTAKYCVMQPKWAKEYISGGPFYILFKGNKLFLNLVPHKQEIWDPYNKPASADLYWEARDVIQKIKG